MIWALSSIALPNAVVPAHTLTQDEPQPTDLQSQLVETKEFKAGVVSLDAPFEAFKAILGATAFLCVVLLLPLLGFAQHVAVARAGIPFNFWTQDHEFQAGDYVFDAGLPGSVTIHREGSNSSIAVPIILYAIPREKENPRIIFVRKDGKYILSELWSDQGRYVVTGEFEHRGEASQHGREVPLTIVESPKQ